jgi:hypothetical protein
MQDPTIREILNHLPSYLTSAMSGFELKLNGEILTIQTTTRSEAELLLWGSGEMLARAGQATQAFSKICVVDGPNGEGHGPLPLDILLYSAQADRKRSESRKPLRETPLNERPAVPLQLLTADAVASKIQVGAIDHCIRGGVEVSELRAA